MARRKDGKLLNEWSKKVRKRDCYLCQICGNPNELTAHHIEAYNLNAKLRCDVNNGITMCEPCHIKLHVKYGGGTTREHLTKFRHQMKGVTYGQFA